jgi:uncharacterized protein
VPTQARPAFRPLSSEEVVHLLQRNHVGRIGYAREGQVDLVPIHYVYADGWLYGRTAPGSKTQAIGELWWPVAFEVDEVSGPFDWRSVVVHGGMYLLRADGPFWEQEEREKAVGLLRRFVPETLTPRDPTPDRTVFFRIAVQEATGREARTGP